MSAIETPIVFLNHIHLSFRLNGVLMEVLPRESGVRFDHHVLAFETRRRSAIVARLALLP
jgi:hypothetical protein